VLSTAYHRICDILVAKWCPNGERGGKLTQVGLSPTMASPNFNSNCCRSPFAGLNSSIRACNFPTASSTV
jgi:hypothetical protein